MRQKSLAIDLIINFFIFELSLFLIAVGIWLIDPPQNFEDNTIGLGAIFMVFPIVIGGIIYWAILGDIYEETCLYKGKARKIYKANKKLAKLKAQKEYYNQRKENNEESMKLQRQICCLKQELKQGYLAICQECGKKIPPNACFCPNCGVIIKEVNQT